MSPEMKALMQEAINKCKGQEVVIMTITKSKN